MNQATWLQDRRMQKFRDVLSRWEHRELSAMEAGEILGMSERQFRRYRQRYDEDGLAGLADRRLGKASVKRVPVDKIVWMLGQYRTHHMGWNVKHFHEHLRRQHNFGWATPGRSCSCRRRDLSSGPPGAGRTGASGRASRAWA